MARRQFTIRGIDDYEQALELIGYNSDNDDEIDGSDSEQDSEIDVDDASDVSVASGGEMSGRFSNVGMHLEETPGNIGQNNGKY